MRDFAGTNNQQPSRRGAYQRRRVVRLPLSRPLVWFGLNANFLRVVDQVASFQIYTQLEDAKSRKRVHESTFSSA